MNTLRTLFLLAAGLSVALSTNEEPVASDRSRDRFRNQILCLMPDSWPIFDNANYGCYCGEGGSGTPVDELDRCCQVHDNCYGEAVQLDECCSIFHNLYTKSYPHKCAKASKMITSEENDYACERFICECDRKASECFSKSPWIPEHEHLPSDRCQ